MGSGKAWHEGFNFDRKIRRGSGFVATRMRTQQTHFTACLLCMSFMIEFHQKKRTISVRTNGRWCIQSKAECKAAAAIKIETLSKIPLNIFTIVHYYNEKHAQIHFNSYRNSCADRGARSRARMVLLVSIFDFELPLFYTYAWTDHVCTCYCAALAVEQVCCLRCILMHSPPSSMAVLS